MNEFMKIAIEEAFEGVRNNDGGPFGAVIVKEGLVIAKAHNQVLSTKDPTAHAEVVAIRKACAKLGTYDLSGCELYSSSEPCPMCLSAIHWARIKKVVYGCTREDAAKIGFDDKKLYELIKKPKTMLNFIQRDREHCLNPFKEWEKKEDRTVY